MNTQVETIHRYSAQSFFSQSPNPFDEVQATEEAGKKGDLLQGLDVHRQNLAHNEAHDGVMRVGMEPQDPNVNHRHEVFVDQPYQFEGHGDQEQSEQ